MEEQLKIDPTIAYDVVELPSRGIHYINQKKSVRVSYLTAADEDILAAPNLIQSNSTLDELLRRKILDRDIELEDIIEEDRQAILIFLRNTAWGSDYKLTLIDPKPKEGHKYIDDGDGIKGKFEQIIDLSSMKMKDFTLESDSNGEYPFFLPKVKLNITFKFLTQKQEKEIENITKTWKSDGIPPTKSKELQLMIKSVDGNRDPMQIRSFIVDKMPIKDSQEFKKYVIKNKPGLDLTQKIIAPSGEEITTNVGFGVEFFRPFYGI